MKLAPNMFLFNVPDVPEAQRFYESLFEIEASSSVPTFATFPLGGGVEFALQNDWSAPPEDYRPNSELVLNVDSDSDEIDKLYATWLDKGARKIEEPKQAPFGYTFVVADPNGNLIRVAEAAK